MVCLPWTMHVSGVNLFYESCKYCTSTYSEEGVSAFLSTCFNVRCSTPTTSNFEPWRKYRAGQLRVNWASLGSFSSSRPREVLWEISENHQRENTHLRFDSVGCVEFWTKGFGNRPAIKHLRQRYAVNCSTMSNSMNSRRNSQYLLDRIVNSNNRRKCVWYFGSLPSHMVPGVMHHWRSSFSSRCSKCKLLLFVTRRSVRRFFRWIPTRFLAGDRRRVWSGRSNEIVRSESGSHYSITLSIRITFPIREGASHPLT